jgi:hypothetical protein
LSSRKKKESNEYRKGGAGYLSFAPQFVQNFAVVGLAVPHFGQLTVAAACGCPGCGMAVPQLLQNFEVCGFWKPHFGQTTMTC